MRRKLGLQTIADENEKRRLRMAEAIDKLASQFTSSNPIRKLKLDGITYFAKQQLPPLEIHLKLSDWRSTTKGGNFKPLSLPFDYDPSAWQQLATLEDAISQLLVRKVFRIYDKELPDIDLVQTNDGGVWLVTKEIKFANQHSFEEYFWPYEFCISFIESFINQFQGRSDYSREEYDKEISSFKQYVELLEHFSKSLSTNAGSFDPMSNVDSQVDQINKLLSDFARMTKRIFPNLPDYEKYTVNVVGEMSSNLVNDVVYLPNLFALYVNHLKEGVLPYLRHHGFRKGGALSLDLQVTKLREELQLQPGAFENLNLPRLFEILSLCNLIAETDLSCRNLWMRRGEDDSISPVVLDHDLSLAPLNNTLITVDLARSKPLCDTSFAKGYFSAQKNVIEGSAAAPRQWLDWIVNWERKNYSLFPESLLHEERATKSMSELAEKISKLISMVNDVIATKILLKPETIESISDEYLHDHLQLGVSYLKERVSAIENDVAYEQPETLMPQSATGLVFLKHFNEWLLDVPHEQKSDCTEALLQCLLSGSHDVEALLGYFRKNNLMNLNRDLTAFYNAIQQYAPRSKTFHEMSSEFLWTLRQLIYLEYLQCRQEQFQELHDYLYIYTLPNRYDVAQPRFGFFFNEKNATAVLWEKILMADPASGVAFTGEKLPNPLTQALAGLFLFLKDQVKGDTVVAVEMLQSYLQVLLCSHEGKFNDKYWVNAKPRVKRDYLTLDELRTNLSHKSEPQL